MREKAEKSGISYGVFPCNCKMNLLVRCPYAASGLMTDGPAQDAVAAAEGGGRRRRARRRRGGGSAGGFSALEEGCEQGDP
jgi:hypothetical protein